MRLKRITLRNFRGIAESTVDFAPGVTIVAGPNEVGKTSIAEAISLLRTWKHSSTRASVRAVQPIGKDLGPDVELEFTARGYEVWVRKRWIKDPITELRITGVKNETLSGDEAHERLGTFLAEHMDVDLFDALEIAQGTSLQEASLARLHSLTGALADGVTNPADHDELIERIEAEYALHFTATGKPKGEYLQLGKRVEELQAALDAAIEASREMDRYTADVEREQLQLGGDEVDLIEAQKELASLLERDAALAELRSAVVEAQREAAASSNALESAEKAARFRESLVAAVLERQEAEAATEAELAKEREEFAKLETRGTSLREARDEARASARGLRAEAHAATRAVEFALARAEHDELQARIAAAERAHGESLEATAVIARTHVDEELLRGILEQETRLSIAQAARDSAVARVKVTPLGDHGVVIDGENVAGEQERSVTASVTIEAPGHLRVEVSPGALPEDLERDVLQAEASLADLLQRGEVETVADARAAHAVRLEAENAKRLAQQARGAALGEETLEDLQERFAAAAQVLANGEEPDERVLDVAALRQNSAAAGQRVDEAEATLTQAEKEHEEHVTAASAAQARVIRLQADALHHAGETQRARAALETARAQTPDEELTAAAKTARECSEGNRDALAAAQQALAEANPEAIEIELDNAREWAQSSESRVHETKLRLERAIALVDDRASKGLYELLSGVEAELAAAEDRLAHADRRAGAAKLLRDVITRHRDEAHASYVAPFAQKITSYGKVVFGPDFGVEITPELTIASRTLAGETVPFDYLSAGAREQLGLLGRLAVAALVDEEDGAPLILDDALGFADEERLASLGAVLNEVGKDAQIIVLTCQPRRFSRVGSAMMVHLPPR